MGDFLTERRALTRIAEAMGVDDVMGAAVLAMAKRWKEGRLPGQCRGMVRDGSD